MKITAFLEIALILLFSVNGCMTQKATSKSDFPPIPEAGDHHIMLGEFVNLMAFSPSGRIFAAGSVKNNIRLWNTKNWDTTANLPHPDIVTNLAFSPRSDVISTVTNELAVGGRRNASIWFWDSATGKNISTFRENTIGHGGITAITYSPDGKLMAVGFGSGLVKLLDVENPASVKVVNERVLSLDSGISYVRFSPEGRLISVATGSGISGPRDSRSFKVLELQTGREVFNNNSISVYGLSFSPDGTVLAVGGNKIIGDRVALTLVLFDTRTWKQIREVKDHPVGKGMEFSSDGKILVSALPGEAISTITVWDTKNGKTIKSLRIADTVTSIALSHDGKSVAAGTESGKIGFYSF